MPLLDVVARQPLGERFVTLGFGNTDERVRQGKTVSPNFLFASLFGIKFWKNGKLTKLLAIDDSALHLAADDVLNTQTDALALQRKIRSDMP